MSDTNISSMKPLTVHMGRIFVVVSTPMWYEYINLRFGKTGMHFEGIDHKGYLFIVAYHAVTFLVIQSPYLIIFRRFK